MGDRSGLEAKLWWTQLYLWVTWVITFGAILYVLYMTREALLLCGE